MGICAYINILGCNEDEVETLSFSAAPGKTGARTAQISVGTLKLNIHEQNKRYIWKPHK